MKSAPILVVMLFAAIAGAQSNQDEAMIRDIVRDEVAAWSKGDADAYSRHFATDGTFTNLQGTYFTGHDAFKQRHDQIFKGVYRGTTKQADIVSLRFVRPDVALLETLQTVTGIQKLLPGTTADAQGRLRTRLLQVLVKNDGEWKIVAYHNVDIKQGVSVPEAK